MKPVKPSFIRRVQANLDYWFTLVSSSEGREWLTTELDSIRTAVAYGIDLPETAEEAGRLAAACYDAVEAGSLEREWLPALEKVVQNKVRLTTSLRLRLFLQWGFFTVRARNYSPDLLIDRLTEAQTLAALQDDRSAQARAEHILALHHRANNRYQEALDAIGRALALIEEKDALWAAIHTTWGIVLFDLEQYGPAEQQFRKAAAVWIALGRMIDLIRTRNHLAHVAIYQKKPALALRRFERVLTLLNGTGDEIEKAVVHINKGLLFYREKRYDEAIKSFGQVNTGYLKRRGRFDLLTLVYHGEGDSTLQLGRPEIAVVPLREAAAAAEQAGLEISWANSTGMLAQALNKLDKTEEATHLLDEAVRVLNRFPEDRFAQKTKKSFEELSFFQKKEGKNGKS